MTNTTLLNLLELCLLAIFVVGCPTKEKTKEASGALPRQIVEGFRLTETKEGRLVYDLNAERAFVYSDSSRIDVAGPNVRFYDENQSLFSVLTADSGTVNTRTSDLIARRRVHVATRDSTVLDTDSLVWRNKEQVVMTDAPVRMRSRQGSVSGTGLVSDAGLKRIEIRNSVQGTTDYDFSR